MGVEVASTAEPQENRGKSAEEAQSPCVLATFTFGMEQFLRLGGRCERSVQVLCWLFSVAFEAFSEKDNSVQAIGLCLYQSLLLNEVLVPTKAWQIFSFYSKFLTE